MQQTPCMYLKSAIASSLLAHYRHQKIVNNVVKLPLGKQRINICIRHNLRYTRLTNLVNSMFIVSIRHLCVLSLFLWSRWINMKRFINNAYIETSQICNNPFLVTVKSFVSPKEMFPIGDGLMGFITLKDIYSSVDIFIKGYPVG